MMKRKNLERAIVAGLLAGCIVLPSAVWASDDFSSGLNFNVQKSDYGIDKDVIDGKYEKKFGDQNIDIGNKGGAGIAFGDWENDRHLTDFTLQTNGNMKIIAKSNKAAFYSQPHYLGAITVDLYNDFNGSIRAANIYMENTVTKTKSSNSFSGIYMPSSHSNDQTKLDIKAEANGVYGDIEFKNFHSAVWMNNNTELLLEANNIKYSNDRNQFKETSSITAIDITGDKNLDTKLKIDAKNDIVFEDVDYGIRTSGNAVNVNVTAGNDIIMTNAKKDGERKEFGISSSSMHSNQKTSEIFVSAGNEIKLDGFKKGIFSEYDDWTGNTSGSNINLNANKINITNTDIGIDISGTNHNVTLDDSTACDNVNYIQASDTAIKSANGANVVLNAGVNNISAGIVSKNDITGLEYSKNKVIYAKEKASVTLNADQNIIKGYVQADNAKVNVNGSTAKNIVTNSYTVYAAVDAKNSAEVKFNGDRNYISGGQVNKSDAGVGVYTNGTAVNATKESSVDINAVNTNELLGLIKAEKSQINIESDNSDNYITAYKSSLGKFDGKYQSKYIGVYAKDNADINITAANGSNYIYSALGLEGSANVLNADDSNITLNAQINILQAGNVTKEETDNFTAYFGDQTAVMASNGGNITIANAGNTKAVDANLISGTIRAEDEGTKVSVTGTNGSNFIYSSAHGKGYGDTNNVAAVFARNEAVVDITGDRNFIATNCGNDDNDEERVIWAQAMGTINLNGATTIIASRAETNGNGDEYKSNSKGIAITAGSEQIVDDGSGKPVDPDKQSIVNVNYKGQYVGGGSVIQGNYISGDIVGGFNGQVNIGSDDKTRSVDDNIYIRGNLLAGNGGEVNASLGKNGILIGRVDDYKEVENEIAGDHQEHDGHIDVYQPAFSNKLEKGGNVSLRMDEGSTWYVTGQSWLTRLDIDGAKINISAQKSEESKYNQKAHALTIREVTSGSNGTFVMDLNHKDHLKSDMLYIGRVVGDNAKANTDKYAVNFDIELNSTILGWEDLVNEELRFATVRDEKIGFRKLTLKNEGIYDIEFDIGNEKFTEDDEDNEDYNGSELDPSKPGNDAIVDKEGNKINWFIQGVKDKEENNSANVIIDMSRANYANAVYMDRLNKRMGEMRYINDEEDAGLWVRMRHDRVGKDDAFKYKSNMYEIGYDEKQNCDNGKRRVGVAIDYMHGDTTYSNVGGKGEISRKGVWLYDTWLGDKGHYADYIAKWGHLANDYEIYNLKNGDKITGDYDNNVFSLSAEYGRKKDMGNNWYIEPQAQLQYSYVTDADYRTTQGTDVSLYSIHSLIGRAGFRLGKDTGERSTIYFKADMLHEFLGDQDIYARDKTGEMRKTYDNKGTWYDLGFGFATALNKDSYLYADFERSFGNDNDNTWQVNVGANWNF